MDQERVDAQIDRIDEIKSARNVGAEHAPDSAEIAGVRFRRPTVSHFWLYARMGRMVGVNPMDKGAMVAYSLAFDAAEVRDRLFAEADKGVIFAKAYEFFEGHGVGPAELERITALASHVFGPADPDAKKKAGG